MAGRVVPARALPRAHLAVRAVSETHRQIVAQVLEREVVGKLLARVAELEADVAALQRRVPNGTSTFESKRHTRLGLPLKYLPIRFNISEDLNVGFDIVLHVSFTTN